MAVNYSAIWQALNPRQQFYLKTVFEEDQAREAAQRAAGASGEWNRTPASEWRTIDAYHEPAAPRELVGITDLQIRWRGAGHHDPGTGATIKILVGHDLITTDLRPTRFGYMHTVAMTKQGRALMRWVTRPRASRTKVPLKERAAEVLGQLYEASKGRTGYLDWRRSPTIDKDLIPRGLARSRGYAMGFEITEEGVAHLAEHHAAYAAAYPKLNLPDPSGAVGWPEAADRLLERLGDECRSLALAAERATEQAKEERRRAEGEFREEFHRRTTGLALALYREIFELKKGHAKALADTYDGYREQMQTALTERVPQYAAATLAAVTALVEGADPVAAMRAQTEAPVAALPAFTPTGVVSVDVEAERLHAECMRKRRHRAATTRKGKAKAATGLQTDAVPTPARGTELEYPWALAAHLHRALRDGYLYRLLTAPPEEPQPKKQRRPAGLLDKVPYRLLVALVNVDQGERHHTRHVVEAYGRKVTPEDLEALPKGLLLGDVRRVTRSAKAPKVLADKGFATDMDLIQFEPRGYHEDTWPLLHITQAGLDHFAEHRATYAELYPDVPLPVQAAEGEA
ncbi:hypothetical protein [Streptomyces sp. NPDC047453]|uniref:hypothetical protein n=1 Tax=Streptomyces sp. NPDC047453 TaxID=3154812 RepID=UPI00341136DA